MGFESDGSLTLAPGESITIPESAFVPVTDPEELREMRESLHRDLCTSYPFPDCAVCEVLDSLLQRSKRD